MDDLSSRLASAQENIASKFLDTCRRGRQSTSLPDDVFACGQYLDQLHSQQRGLHGTAAAIHVLASAARSDEQRATVRGLVEYVRNRPKFETDERQKDVERDAKNVIKQAELLHALGAVRSGIAETEETVRLIAERLNGARTADDHGWSYFVNDSSTTAEILPTAHAARALAEHGHNVSGPIAFLLGSLEAPSRQQTDRFVEVNTIYMMAYLPDHALPKDALAKLRSAFRRVWADLERLLDHPIEANIEYTRDDDHFYVRVPWQLLLIATAARLDHRRFATIKTQRHLDRVIQAAQSQGGFLYPHSGERLSARTNGILYIVLARIMSELAAVRPINMTFWHTVDRGADLLYSRFVRGMAALFGLALIVWSIYLWFTDASSLAADLGPEFTGGLLLTIVSGLIISLFAARR